MTSGTLGSIERADLASAAATNGAINAVINGAIQLFLLRGHGTIALSVDAISTDKHTVLGGAVILAVSLAMILTAVTHLTLKGPGTKPLRGTGACGWHSELI